MRYVLAILLLVLLSNPLYAADEVFIIPSTTRAEGIHPFSRTSQQKNKRIMSFSINRAGFGNPAVTAVIRVMVTYPEGVLTCGIKIVGGIYPSPTSGQECQPPSNWTFIQSISGTIVVSDDTPAKIGRLNGAAVITLK